jgi:hypothetical protein
MFKIRKSALIIFSVAVLATVGFFGFSLAKASAKTQQNNPGSKSGIIKIFSAEKLDSNQNPIEDKAQAL